MSKLGRSIETPMENLAIDIRSLFTAKAAGNVIWRIVYMAKFGFLVFESSTGTQIISQARHRFPMTFVSLID